MDDVWFFQTFLIAKSALESMPIQCYGSESCCTPDNLCKIHEGDCTSEEDCVGRGLVCGTNNCLNISGIERSGGNWDVGDDCCERRCTPEHPCSLGDGDCNANADCNDLAFLNCRENSCLDTSLFPAKDFPLNTADK